MGLDESEVALKKMEKFLGDEQAKMRFLVALQKLLGPKHNVLLVESLEATLKSVMFDASAIVKWKQDKS